ncbi:MAG: nodulation protein NfeD [Anaerolineales bacterium]|jgi:membrane-bound serine protease (ClpP class)
MRGRRFVLAFVLGWMLSALTVPAAAQDENAVLLLSAQGPLTPAMAEYLDRGLARAVRESAEAVIFQLDTPGGAVDLMNRMVQSMRASAVPIVVYIAPRGAMAGSAGTVITLAGHVAAMAPETAIGAASPVGMQGEDLGETIETKTVEILKATVRSLASGRGDEAIALAEAAIEEAKAATAQEALQVGLIDIIADDLDDLLIQLDGRSVETVIGTQQLQTIGVRIEEVPQSFIEQALQALTNPNIVFLLLTVGVQAILIEISSPGGWVAGFIGVVCLAFGTYGLGVLPVNWVGLIFIITAFVLFILEIKATTHGALAAAGVASFIVGALVLFNSPGTPSFQRVSIPLVVSAGIFTAAIFMFVLTFAIRAQRRPRAVGAESLIGRIGVVRKELNPSGSVLVGGELWSAELEDEELVVQEGTRVEVVGVEGLRLNVREAPRRSK